MGLFSKLLDIGASFNYITPALALASGGANFATLSQSDTQRALRRAGVRSWAWDWTGEYYIFCVSPADAARVAEILKGD
jgi:hypothetical protein